MKMTWRQLSRKASLPRRYRRTGRRTETDLAADRSAGMFLTPHLGADTTEAQDNVGIAIAEEVIAALHGEMVPNAVICRLCSRQS